MKTTILSLLIVVMAFIGAKAQTNTETRTLNAFDQLDVSDAIEVELQKGKSKKLPLLLRELVLTK